MAKIETSKGVKKPYVKPIEVNKVTAFVATFQDCAGLKLDAVFHELARIATKNDIRLYVHLPKSKDTTEDQVRNNATWLANEVSVVTKEYSTESKLTQGLSKDSTQISKKIVITVGEPVKLT